jgi:hypothetical protein
MGPIKAPFDKEGALMHYARYGYGPDHYYGAHEWRVPEPIALRLTLEQTERGRSAAYFIWLDDEGRRWPMFMTDLAHLLHHGTVAQGVADGMWIPRKRGENFGLRFEGPRPAESCDV